MPALAPSLEKGDPDRGLAYVGNGNGRKWPARQSIGATMIADICELSGSMLKGISILATDAEWYDGRCGGANILNLQVSAVVHEDAEDDPLVAAYVLELIDCHD
mmetsp:Transcript_34845/g.80567  ORF Transcript_34845/g.80567 Transcript_34845/m.80567 type:complete len:104 (-) Transcript_34845:1132-1443(-)